MSSPMRGTVIQGDLDIHKWCKGDLTSVKMEKPHAQAKLLSPTEKCKICYEQAAKHIHYGAMTCFSCRAFFRRSIQNKTAATYNCRRNKSCEINLKTRKNCQYCRYQKCIVVGMKPTWVLTEEERQKRFRKVREKQQENPARNRNSYVENDFTETTDTLEESIVDTECGMEESSSEENLHHEKINRDHAYVGQSFITVQSSTPRRSNANNISIQCLKIKNEPTPAMSPVYTEVQVKQESTSQASTSTGRSSPQSLHYSGYNQSKLLLGSSGPTSVIVQPSQFNVGYSLLSDDVISRKEDDCLLGFESEENNFNAEEEDPDLNDISEFVDTLQPYISLAIPAVSSTDPSRSLHSPEYTDKSRNSLYEGKLAVENLAAVESDEAYTSSDEETLLTNNVYRNEPEIVFSVEESILLQKLVETHNERYRSVNFGEELIKEMIMCSMFSIPVSTTAAINGYRLCVERVTRIANSLESFRSLTKADQSTLLKENADLLVSLRGAIFFDSQKKGVDQVMISMGVDDLETIRTMFSQLLKEDNMKHIDYKTFNSIQAVGHNPTEDRYNFIQDKIGKLLNDEVISILLTYVVLFSCDFCVLINPDQVQSYQDQFSRWLQRYIYSKFPRHLACLKFAVSMEVVTLIREMADIKKSRYINQNVRVVN